MHHFADITQALLGMSKLNDSLHQIQLFSCTVCFGFTLASPASAVNLIVRHYLSCQVWIASQTEKNYAIVQGEVNIGIIFHVFG